MLQKTILALAMVTTSAGVTLAACPPPAPGNTPAEIQANGQRIVCLQNELAAESRQRSLQFQIDALEKSQQDLLLQRRIDSLPPVPVYVPPPPVVLPGS